MTKSLPDNIKRFFWDINGANFDLANNRRFVVERLLELGDDFASNWLFANYSKTEITDILKCSTRLSAKSANFWGLILDIPNQEILCLRKSFLNKPGTIWSY